MLSFKRLRLPTMSYLSRYVVVQRMARPSTWIEIFKGQRKTFNSTSVNYEKYQTMANVKQNLIKVLEIKSNSSSSKMEFLNLLVKTQKDLPTKKMKNSFDQAVIPLSKDLELRDKYTTGYKTVRFGRLMEDVDMFAVWCAVKHIYGDVTHSDQMFPYIHVVTIRVDDIEIFTDKTETTSDIRISGHVSWVGKTSIEVYVWMDQWLNRKWQKILRALVLVAARNAINFGPAIVNPVEGETEEEKQLLQGGEGRRRKRLEFLEQSLLTTVPTAEELNIVHKLFTETVDPSGGFLYNRILPPNSQWMQNAFLSTVVLCHPEYRNVYNKIFGGFLIRQALELAWCTAAVYTSVIPKLKHISDIIFHNPVDLGSFLKLNAGVTYTEKQYLQVFVYAETVSIENLIGKNTTSFNFLFYFPKPVNQIYPSTYLDAMRYIDGRRRFLEARNQSAMGVK